MSRKQYAAGDVYERKLKRVMERVVENWRNVMRSMDNKLAEAVISTANA